jgi:hypothetical protein
MRDPATLRTMTARHATAVLAGITLLVLVLSLPGSLRDAFNRGGIYVFSRAFFEDLPVLIVAPYSLTRALSNRLARLYGHV